MSTFVSVGNAHQPFGRLLEAVRAIAQRLPQPVIVQHGYTPFDDAGCTRVSFLGMDEFIRQICNSDLLITHAGAGSVIHALQAGKVPVIMPRRFSLGEHINDHQVEFARALADIGKAILAEETSDLEGAVEKALRLQRTSEHNASNKNFVPPMVELVDQVLSEHARHLSATRK